MTGWIDEEDDHAALLQIIRAARAEFFYGNLSNPAEVVKRASIGRGLEPARAGVLKHLRKGVIQAFATKAHVIWAEVGSDKKWPNGGAFERWVEQNTFIFGGRGPIHGLLRIDPSFWGACHAVDDPEWMGEVELYKNATSADWGNACFRLAAIEGRFSKEGDEQKSQPGNSIAAVTELYGVGFDSADVAAVYPEVELREVLGRPSKYNWEAAIAAFAGAQQKHDVIPDMYAHGAQAEIERWLATWFSAKGQSPSEAAIRPKAALILDEYQKADKLTK